MNHKTSRRLALLALVAGGVIGGLALVCHHIFSPERHSWAEEVLLPDSRKIVVFRTNSIFARQPSKNSYDLEIARQKLLPAGTSVWSSREWGQLVVRPVGLRLLEDGTPRLITRVAAGRPDGGRLKLTSKCSLYFAFEHKAGVWVQDIQGPNTGDIEAFASEFNLHSLTDKPWPLGSPIDGKYAVATKRRGPTYAPELLRLVPTANLKNIFNCSEAK